MFWLLFLFVILILVVVLFFVFSPKNYVSKSNNLNPEEVQYAKTHKATALVVSCIDYRFVEATMNQLQAKLGNDFDFMAMAGSSLYVVKDGKLAFRQTFYENLDIAIELQHIHKILFVQHQDCGALAGYLGKSLTSEAEKQFNINLLKEMKVLINQKYPTLRFEGYLADFEGELHLLI